MSDLSKRIEYTNVQPTATQADARSLCKQALINDYRAVCVNSSLVNVCYDEFREEDPEKAPKIVTTAGFPNGGATYQSKIYEAIFACEHEQANEVDVVLNIGLIKARKDNDVRREIKQIKMNLAGLAPVKFIIEAPLLTEEEIVRVCGILMEEKAEWVKTATGFNGPTTVEMVKLIKKTVGKRMKIKAAGGIRDIETVKEMIRAGADTIGTSTLIKFDEE
ncbi:MAG: deoxyribose-phosphate aldolase [Clostridia bacterium]|nr:deoxyribose-phosphate aldolase [Clostridia bacterium]